MNKKLEQVTKADIPDTSVLQVIHEVQNCTLGDMHRRLVSGRAGITMLDLGRLRDRLVETGLVEKVGHFAHHLTEAGEALLPTNQKPRKRKILTLEPA